MKRTTITITTALAAAALTAATASAAPTAASQSLERCQRMAQAETAKYATQTQRALALCLQKVAQAVVRGNPAGPTDVSGAVGTCLGQLHKIGRTDGKSLGDKMEAKVRRFCDPSDPSFAGSHTAADVLGPGAGVNQPLQAAGIGDYCASFAAGSATFDEWLGCLKGAAECQARQQIAVSFPRALEWMNQLDAAFTLSTHPRVATAQPALQAAEAAIDGGTDDDVPELSCGPGGGPALETCENDLETCETEAQVCEGELETCETVVETCEGDLETCETVVETCESDLETCETDLEAAELCGNGAIDPGEDCDLGTLGGATCATEGFTGGVLSCLNGCAFDTSGCWLTRFVDNADGTITDNQTGLTWEKKTELNGTSNIANPHDADNFYRWSGTCSIATSKRCQPNAAAAALCAAHVEGDPTGCAECTGGDGVCNVSSPGITIWQWVADLNTASFAGHADWRVPALQELIGIVDYADTTSPTVDVAFHGGSCGAACTDITNPACSCTRSSSYWSASTYAPNPGDAWIVFFTDGFADAFSKSGNGNSVRAVRAGS